MEKSKCYSFGVSLKRHLRYLNFYYVRYKTKLAVFPMKMSYYCTTKGITYTWNQFIDCNDFDGKAEIFALE